MSMIQLSQGEKKMPKRFETGNASSEFVASKKDLVYRQQNIH
jgi:hypothetical protein